MLRTLAQTPNELLTHVIADLTAKLSLLVVTHKKSRTGELATLAARLAALSDGALAEPSTLDRRHACCLGTGSGGYKTRRLTSRSREAHPARHQKCHISK